MKSRIYFILFVNFFCMASCTNIKELIYFQDKKAAPPSANQTNLQRPVHTISVGDIISLNINTPMQTSAQILNQKEGAGGFQVKGDSTIDIPVIGTVKIAGLTMTVAKDTLLRRAKIYLNEPYVNLQLLSYKVTVLGEVNSPGIKALLTENATLLDAIASSGDLTNFGNRTNIKVLRGDKIFYLNLTDIDIFKSDGFYLQSNDVVYVQPLRKKNALSNLQTVLTLTSFASLILSVTTTIILLKK